MVRWEVTVLSEGILLTSSTLRLSLCLMLSCSRELSMILSRPGSHLPEGAEHVPEEVDGDGRCEREGGAVGPVTGENILT